MPKLQLSWGGDCGPQVQLSMERRVSSNTYSEVAEMFSPHLPEISDMDSAALSEMTGCKWKL